MEFAVRHAFLGLIALLTASPAALAQDCGQPSLGMPPILHLSETATISIEPNLLVADLVATSQSPSAVTTQRRVNDLVAQANVLAGKVPGIIALFQDYETYFVERAPGVPGHWEGSHTLEISGLSGEEVLGLVGQLQGMGLTLGNLGWQVGQDEQDAAARKARLQALATLRREAEESARTLGLFVQGYQSVDLTSGPSPGTQFRSNADADGRSGNDPSARLS
jgi:uncharacterized protein YggE